MARKQVIAKEGNGAMQEWRLALVKEALQAYGIDQKYLHGCGVIDETEEVILVTNGGKKVRYKRGQPVTAILSEVEITGIAPKVEMVWDAKLNQRRPKDKGIPPDVEWIWDAKLNQGRLVDR